MKNKIMARLIIVLTFMSPSVFATQHHVAPVHHHVIVHHTKAVFAAKHETTKHKVAETKVKSLKHQKAKGATAGAAKVLKPAPGVAKESINSIFKIKGNPKFLTSKEVLTLASNPNIKGQAAAILAVLVMNVNDAKINPDKMKYVRADLLKEFTDKSSGYYVLYQNTLKKINDVRALPDAQKLFGPNGLSANTRIIQGSEGDCYFLSAVNGLLRVPNGPAALQKMIKPVKGEPNTFTVTFPGDPVVETVKLTETEIAMFSLVEKGGKWLAILSAAEAMKRDRMHIDPATLMKGGFQTQTMGLLTGQKYVLHDFGQSAPMTAAGEQRVKHIIEMGIKKGLPVGIQTNDHDLTVIGYKEGNVIIKNPWGTSNWYNPKTGDWYNTKAKPTVAGPWYFMKNGVFSVPVAQINDGFYNLSYHPENEPAVTPAAPAVPPSPSTTS